MGTSEGDNVLMMMDDLMVDSDSDNLILSLFIYPFVQSAL